MLPTDELSAPSEFEGDFADWLDRSVRSAPLHLDDGSRVEVTVSEAGGIVITRHAAEGSLVARFSRPLPGEGFAGGGTALSPSQRYLVLDHYSGQSETGFILLDLADGLDLVRTSGYLPGSYASYAFSPSEARLLMALPVSYGDWWTDRRHEDPLERDDDGSTYLEYARMVTCDCASGDVWFAPLVVVPDITEPVPETYEYDLDPRFVDETTVRLSMPWGETTVVVSDPPTMTRVVYPLA